MNSESVTTVITRKVRPDRVDEFELWLSEGTPIARGFEGFLGRDIIRPSDHSHPEYVIIMRFDSYEHLRTWLESRDRHDWLEESKRLAEEETHIVQASGMELWFTLPNRDGGGSRPPKYKLTALTILAIYPLVVTSSFFLVPQLTDLHPLFSTLISVSIISALMSYLVMPWITKIFAFWLYPSMPSITK
jgi:antibiotic biosynthesis monooxygenase (ABM) superfamily enzyme